MQAWEYTYMNSYLTATETDVRFATRAYPSGTYVRVLSGLVHDGVALVRFPEGEETYVAAYRLTTPPPRAFGVIAEAARHELARRGEQA